MGLLSCLLVVLTASAEPDTIWVTDFSEIPQGWESDLHWSTDGGVRLTLNSQVQSVFDFDHSSLSTDYYRNMPDTDSLVLVVNYAWTGWGAFTGGEVNDGAYSRSRINVHCDGSIDTLWDSIAASVSSSATPKKR